MGKFLELLYEANQDTKYVYHVTNFDSTKNILKYNYFRPTKNVETGKNGLSTTFDKNYNWGGGGIKFVLDYKKIR